MRIAMLGPYPLDEGRIVGGIEAVMVPLLRALQLFSDLEFHVVTCQPDITPQLSKTGSGLPLHVLERHRFGRLTFHRRDVANLLAALDRIGPGLVHAQGIGLYALAALAAPGRHLVTAQGLGSRETAALSRTSVDRPGALRRLTGDWRGKVDSYYEHHILAKVRNLVSISPYVDQTIEAMGERFPAQAFRGRLFHIENPVDDRFFAIGEPQDQPTVLYVGRVIPRKGLLELLKSFALVTNEFPEFQLRIAGETDAAPEYVDACRRFVGEHHLETAVVFLGSLTMEQVIAEYRNCGLVALPSLQETSPVAVAEAMAAGRAVVTNRTCGMPYLVEHEQSGLLLDYGDTRAWAAALRRLLADAALRNGMGHLGRAIAEQRFRPAVIAAATRAAYYEIVGGSL